jgi:hypothetical protein
MCDSVIGDELPLASEVEQMVRSQNMFLFFHRLCHLERDVRYDLRVFRCFMISSRRLQFE